MKTSTHFSSTLILIALALFALGCSNSNPVTTQGNGSSTLTGNVASYSADGLRVLDSSRVQVLIEGTSFSATSDHAGNFTINGIPAGVYNIIFSKPGFDTMIYPVHHLLGEGTDIFNDPFLLQNSPDSIVFDKGSINVKDTGTRDSFQSHTVSWDFNAHLTGPDTINNYTLYMILPNDSVYIQVFGLYPYMGSIHQSNSFFESKTRSEHYLKSGDSVYFIATIAIYPKLKRDNTNSNSQYYGYLSPKVTKQTRQLYIVP